MRATDVFSIGAGWAARRPRRSARALYGVGAALAAAICGASCGSEPAFDEACADECACTADSEACGDGCDNRYRRTWVLAAEESEACRAAYEAYFQCLLEQSVCADDGGFPKWGPPDGACDALENAHFDC